LVTLHDGVADLDVFTVDGSGHRLSSMVTGSVAG